MKRPIQDWLAAFCVSGLIIVGGSIGVALPAHAEGDATDDTVQVVEADKAETEKPASPPPAPKPAPIPDPPAEVKEVVTDDSEADADAAAAKLAADEAAAEAAKAKAAAEAKAKAEAEADAAKAAADKAAADAKVATETTDPVVEDPPADEAVDPNAPLEEVVEEPEPDPEPPAEPATSSSVKVCVLNDAVIRITVSTGDGKSYPGETDVDGDQVSPESGGEVPGVFFDDYTGQDSVLVKVTARDAPFVGDVTVDPSCSGGSGDDGSGDPGDGGGGDPEPEPVGPLPSKVNDINMSTTVNEQIVLLDDASWAHIDDEFKCTPNNGQVFDAWGVNPEVYYLPNEGFTGVDEFTCTVTRGDKSLTFQVKVTVTEPDADGDGTPDKDDAFPQDPKESKDSDEDGVGDNADAFPQDPAESKDSDGDKVGDNADKCESTPPGESVDVNGCSASQRDGDRDGLTDAEEAELGTDPKKADTDGDGYSDGVEVEEGTNPLDPASHPGEVRPPQPEAIFTQKTVEDKSCKKGLRTQLQDFVSEPEWVNGEWVFGPPVLLEAGPWVKVRSLSKSEKAELKCSVDKDKDTDKDEGPSTGSQNKAGDLPDEDNGDDPGMTQYVVAVVQGALVILAFGVVMLVSSLRRKEQEAI